MSAELGNKRRPSAPFAARTRLLVFAGTITLRMAKLDDAAVAVKRVTAKADGFVSDDARSINKTEYRAKLTLRIPSRQFSSVLGDLAALGTQVSRQQAAQDVSDDVVNLDARICITQESVERLGALLNHPQSVRDPVSLESELYLREVDLESLKLRRSKLDSQITLSTITVELIQNAPKPKTGFLAGLATSWHVVTISINVLTTVVGAALPWLLALTVLSIAALFIVQRIRRSRGPASSDN